jgi:hypothetical protein
MHLVMTLLLDLQTPAPPAEPPEPAPAVSLDRIRRGLESPPTTVTVLSTSPDLPPIFRLEIRDRPLPYDHLWEHSWTPAYVRTTRGLYHHEFLTDVTPDFFRATSVHPCCPVLPLVNFLADRLRKGTAGNAESKARLEVKKALKDFLDLQKKTDEQKDQRDPDAR